MTRRASRETEASMYPRKGRRTPGAAKPPARASTMSKFVATHSAKRLSTVSALKPPSKKGMSAGAFVPDYRGLRILGGIVVAVLLVVYGIILLRSNSLGYGAGAIIAGLALFLFAARYLNTLTWSGAEVAGLSRSGFPASLVVLGVFFSALAANEVTGERTPIALTLSTSYWLVSVVCFAAGILWLQRWRPSPAAYATWIRANYRELLIVVVVVAAGLAARLYALDFHPYPWSGDEGTVAGEAGLLLKSPNPDLFDAGWSGNPFPAFFPPAAVVSLLGSSILAVRVASAITGALTVLFLYLLARELFDRTTALIAAVFLSTFPFHLQFSRVGVLTIQDGLVVTLVLWLVVRAVHKDKLSDYLWAGIASGLTLYTYVGGRLVLALAFAALAFVSVRQKGFFLSHRRHLAVYVGATLVTLAPMAAFFAQHMQDFNSRFGQVSIIQSGWLTHELTIPGTSLGSILWDQFTRSVLVYVSEPAYGNFFNSPQPYLSIVGSLFFLIGMGVAFQQLLRPPFMIVLTWFWSVVIIGGVLTISPPASTRMIMTAPAVALLIAIGLGKVLEILSYVRVPRAWRAVTTALVVAFLVVQNGVFYFGPYRAGNYFDDANAEVAMQAGLELRDLGPRYAFAMLGAPRMFSDFPTIVFLNPTSPRIDIDPVKASSADLSGQLPAFIVATPDNLGPLMEIAQHYPGGKWEAVPSKSRNEMLYYAYTIDATSAQTTP
jgi:4-amino-4-deoxy-L-arabinose transferase-like glycosyltransferase